MTTFKSLKHDGGFMLRIRTTQGKDTGDYPLNPLPIARLKGSEKYT